MNEEKNMTLNSSISFDVDFSLRPFNGVDAAKVRISSRAFSLDGHCLIRLSIDHTTIEIVQALQTIDLARYRDV